MKTTKKPPKKTKNGKNMKFQGKGSIKHSLMPLFKAFLCQNLVTDQVLARARHFMLWSRF